MKPLVFLLSLLAAAAPLRAFELYVATTGSDRNPGTLTQPLATLGAAQALVASLRAGGALPSGPVTVYLRGGYYDQPSTVAFTSADSGSAAAPVTYASYPGEAAHITGAITLNPSWFTLVTASSPVWSRLDPSAQGQVYEVNLSAHGIANWGTLQPRGFGLRAPAPMELFVNGQAMTLAQWPNVGSPPATTNTAAASTQFTYTGNRPSRWTQATDIWMHGFWSQDWADFHVPVGSINPAAQTVTLASAPAQYGIGAQRPYYAYNLLEELDTPGEYYLDRTSGILYYWPTTPLAGSVIQVSLLETPVVSLNGASYLTFQGIIFEATRGPLVTITGGNDNELVQCLLRNAGQFGAQISGTNNGVTQSQVAFCGEEGVIVTGGDRPSLTAGDNFVTHSSIHGTGRIDWTYKPAINLNGGCGNFATNNLIDDLPHAAILFTGNNHLMAYNEIWHVCQITGDSGAIYCGRQWGYRGNVIEYNYLHDISSSLGSADVNGVYLDDCMSGVTVYSNIFYLISGTAVFCGGGRDNLISNNLIAYCGTAHYNDDRGVTQIDNVSGDAWNLLQTLGADGVQYQAGNWTAAYPACAAIPASWTALQQGLWRNPQNCVFSHNAGWGNSAWTFQSDSSNTGVFSVYADLADNNAAQSAVFGAAAAEDRAQRAATLAAPSLAAFAPVPFAAIGPDESAAPAATVAPATPLLTGRVASASTVELDWTLLQGVTNSAAASFALQYLEGAAWTTFENTGGQMDFSGVAGLSAATTYTFRVVATNAAGSSTSNSVSLTTAAAALQAGTAAQIPAGLPLVVVKDMAVNGTVGVQSATQDTTSSVRMYDAGDAIQINFTVATAGTYELGVYVRSGGSTGPTSFWPGGYSAQLDGAAVTLTGDSTSLSALDSAYGGCFWGMMDSSPMTLAAGLHSLIVTADSNWAVVAYLKVTAMTAAGATSAATALPVTVDGVGSAAAASGAGGSSSSSSSSAGASSTAAGGSSLPQSGDIGIVNTAGASVYANGVYTLTGSGADIWNSVVGFQYNYQTLVGDGVIVARVDSLTETDPWAKAGVMIRDGTAASAAYAAMFVTASNGLAFQWGAGSGASSNSAGAPGAAPSWVRLARLGSAFTADCSPDGVTWTNVGSATITMGASVCVGFAVTSHNASSVATATFDSLSLTGVAAEPDTASTSTAASAPSATTTATTAGSTPAASSSTSSTTGGSTTTTSTTTGTTSPATTSTSSASPSTAGATTSSTTTGTTAAATSGSTTSSSTTTGTTSPATTSTSSASPSTAGATTSTTTAGTSPAATASSTSASAWTSADVGAVAIAGTSSFAGGVYTLTGSGADIWDTTVGFQFDYQTLTGDGSIVARVTSLQVTDSWAKAGIMIRDTTGAQAAYAAVFLTGSNGIAFQGGNGNGASCWSAGAWGAIPYWVRLTRAGSTFTADCSPDGVTWTNVGAATVSMGASVCIGLVVTSHNAGTATTATIDSVTLTGTSTSSSSTTAAASMLSDSNSSSGNSASSTTMSTPSTGTSSTGTASSPTSGTSSTSSSTAGTTTSSTTATTSPAATGTSSSATASTPSSSTNSSGNGSSPASGTSSTSSSAAGTTTSSPASVTSLPATGGSTSIVTSSSASATSTALSSPWTSSDIGSVAIAGTATLSNAVYTLTGSGSDIWNSNLGFQYASQTLAGDGTLTAQVTSLQNTDGWAKAGVMMRAGANTDPTAPFAAVYVTPGNGVAFQWRNVDGWDCYSTSISGAAPAWVRLTRSGGTFTAYASPDGVTWTTLGTATITVTVSNPVSAGLVVSSHNNSVAAAATFASVTLSSAAEQL